MAAEEAAFEEILPPGPLTENELQGMKKELAKLNSLTNANNYYRAKNVLNWWNSKRIRLPSAEIRKIRKMVQNHNKPTSQKIRELVQSQGTKEEIERRAHSAMLKCPSIACSLSKTLLQSLALATTPAEAAAVVQQAPKPVVENALRSVPPTIDPKIIASIILQATRKGVKIPPQTLAPAITTNVSAPVAVAVSKAVPPETLAKAILSAVKKGTEVRPEVVSQAISAPTPVSAAVAVSKAVPPETLAKAILSAVKKGTQVRPEVVSQAISAPTPAPVATSVARAVPPEMLAKAIVSAFKKGLIPRSEAITAQPPEVIVPVIQKIIPKSGNLASSVVSALKKAFGKISGKDKMPTFGPETQPNFIEPVKTGVNNQGRNTYNQKPPAPGYILTTRNGKTGWYRNKGAAPPPSTGTIGPTQPRNYTKMGIRELLDALRKYPENRPVISEALRKALEKELKDIKYEYSKSRRARKLGDLLRLLPRNFNGRRNASSMVVNDIRDTRNGRELSNLRSNLGRVPNENIRRALENQNRRFRRDGERERARGRSNGGGSYSTPRRYGESNNNYTRRVRNTEGQRELMELMRRRRAARVGGAGAGAGPVGGGNFGGGGRGGGNVGAGGPAPPPPLPTNQQQAINNAGGVTKAMNTVVQVPGGAPEVAKAAEALNESKGNTTYAIRVKGASPEAVNAVQKLGGPNNTVQVLEGLNTMSKTHGTRKRARTTRRSKKVLRPRVAELARVISAVKKQRLISLVAHNVTKTHNIHPNDEKLKKYYMKVLKANILRTPFAKIAKGAAKKK